MEQENSKFNIFLEENEFIKIKKLQK